MLYLTYDGLTDGLGRSQVLPYIIGLCGIGHTYTIVSFEKEERFSTDKDAVRELIEPYGIEWVPLRYTSTPPILSTVFDILKLKRTVLKLLRSRGFEVVHCRSYITSLIGMHLKKHFGVRFIFDMRAFYADERIDGGLWNLRNPIYRAIFNYFKRKEKEFLSTADHTISLTSKGRDIIHGWKGIGGQPIPIEVIPCCADLDHFNPSKVIPALKQQLSAKLGLEGKGPVLVYLGSIGTWYMLREMLDLFKVMLKTKPDAGFLFITTDPPERIRLQAEERGIRPDSLAIHPAKREEVPTFLSLADVAIFFIKPVFSKSGSSPTKHGEMLGMGLPVIANSGVGDVDSIIEATGSGILVREFTEEAYGKAVCQIGGLLKTPVSTLQQAAQEYYSLQKGVERYDRVYRSL